MICMLQKIFKAIFGDPNEKELKKLWPVVHHINGIEKKYQETLKDEYFPAKTAEFKERLQKGETLDDLLPEAFALVKNACRRLIGKKWLVRGRETTWDMIPFDVQLLGGMVLHQGKIAEMKTGEGKTLVCTMPIYLNALAGKGVFLVTVNDYLAQRDSEWMGGLYKFLGMSVGVIIHGQTHEQKREAYNCDITYGTNNEYGFDYLRDNMASDLEEIVQRELNYAIVDEVDSILIDEARTPLIISAPAEESTEKYHKYSRLIPQLKETDDYIIDEKLKAATLTEAGIAKMEKFLSMENIYTEGGFQEVHHIEQALKAHTLFKLDIDYVVKEGEVIIVDEFTGRLMPGRRYSDGLHQAIEAKENVEVKRESRTLATVSFQNYFRLFKKLAGMTGTAMTEAEEFARIYKLDTLVMPTNKDMVRIDNPDAVYKNQKGKFMTVTDRVKKLHKKGQPVLIGTISIEKSEMLSKLLALQGIPHTVLNAKFHEKEAEIVAKAGQKGAVTIATNMAGRGTDIKLGQGVCDAGGLYILGTERHESRRIDNQLRGRSGRQGDPGESQFFVSLDDELMRLFGADRVQKMMEFLKVPDDMPIENRMISNSIEGAQKKVEGRNFEIRKHLVEYDDVMNKQREIIYSRRRKMLFSQDIKNDILVLIEKEAEAIVLNHAGGRRKEEWDFAKIAEAITALHKDPKNPFDLKKLENFDETEEMIDFVKHYLWEEYAEREKLLPDYEEEKGSATLRNIERAVYLRSLDMLWMEHIDNMSHLREGVALRGYSQKDPLIEYKQEGFQMFAELMANIRTNTVNTLFKLEFRQQVAAPMMRERRPTRMMTNEDQIERVLGGERDLKEELSENPVVVKVGAGQGQSASAPSAPSAGRNDPCPCGSKKKYKKCCGK
ncbi:preprotein translocase subunit SecA [Candidatus Peregrinibacteria bacterium]|nr:preprotein translocase subunit SecA [Candidatus Peregrinibacteria bacterium]